MTLREDDCVCRFGIADHLVYAEAVESGKALELVCRRVKDRQWLVIKSREVDPNVSVLHRRRLVRLYHD